METEYRRVEPRRRISKDASNGTTARAIRCRQVNRGESSTTATGGVALTKLFHHIVFLEVEESDLQVSVYPAFHLKAAIVGGVEADPIRVLILSRPTYRSADFHVASIQDGKREVDLHRV